MQPLPSGSYSTARKLSLVEEKLVLQDGVKQPLTLLCDMQPLPSGSYSTAINMQ
jgi:hypothetical protein